MSSKSIGTNVRPPPRLTGCQRAATTRRSYFPKYRATDVRRLQNAAAYLFARCMALVIVVVNGLTGRVNEVNEGIIE